MADLAASAGTLHLLYFAWLRERVGTGEERVAVPAGVATVADLVAWLRGRSAGHAAAFAAANRVRCAVNQEFAGPEARLAPGDEVAFFPPVTGG
jgi:molybdopterin synthase sulfur carrier subunit